MIWECGRQIVYLRLRQDLRKMVQTCQSRRKRRKVEWSKTKSNLGRHLPSPMKPFKHHCIVNDDSSSSSMITNHQSSPIMTNHLQLWSMIIIPQHSVRLPPSHSWQQGERQHKRRRSTCRSPWSTASRWISTWDWTFTWGWICKNIKLWWCTVCRFYMVIYMVHSAHCRLPRSAALRWRLTLASSSSGPWSPRWWSWAGSTRRRRSPHWRQAPQPRLHWTASSSPAGQSLENPHNINNNNNPFFKAIRIGIKTRPVWKLSIPLVTIETRPPMISTAIPTLVKIYHQLLKMENT